MLSMVLEGAGGCYVLKRAASSSCSSPPFQLRLWGTNSTDYGASSVVHREHTVANGAPLFVPPKLEISAVCQQTPPICGRSVLSIFVQQVEVVIGLCTIISTKAKIRIRAILLLRVSVVFKWVATQRRHNSCRDSVMSSVLNQPIFGWIDC